MNGELAKQIEGDGEKGIKRVKNKRKIRFEIQDHDTLRPPFPSFPFFPSLPSTPSSSLFFSSPTLPFLFLFAVDLSLLLRCPLEVCNGVMARRYVFFSYTYPNILTRARRLVETSLRPSTQSGSETGWMSTCPVGSKRLTELETERSIALTRFARFV